MLHQYEKLVIAALLDKASTLDEICRHSRLSRDSVVRALYWLKEKNAVELTEERVVTFKLEEEGKRFCEGGFPEKNLLAKVAKGEVDISTLSREELQIGLTWAKRLNWVDIVSHEGKRFLRITPKGQEVLVKGYEPEKVCRKLAIGAVLSDSDKELLRSLLSRGRIVSMSEKVEIRHVKLTAEGERLASQEVLVPPKNEVNALTKDLIVSGRWREVSLRRYDSKAPVERVFPAKRHPLSIVMDRIREIFVELGFEEMEGGMIESSFWNFDALFQPQDHPARDLADTFYLTSPDRIEIPDSELARKVAKVHQSGWRYRWSKELAEQPVLRTHTTALSARYVAETGKGKRKAPAKYFAIGRVYRNEATDFKHLAEFQQVEGIIIDESANFRQLLGVLREFYQKLGFEKIRFRPHYFPYTEPSLEIDVFYEPKQSWLELGGAGIFRPEVCLPLWGKYPVLAWGLALERPVMILLGLDDIRTFYKNDLGWLRNLPLSKSWV